MEFPIECGKCFRKKSVTDQDFYCSSCGGRYSRLLIESAFREHTIRSQANKKRLDILFKVIGVGYLLLFVFSLIPLIPTLSDSRLGLWILGFHRGAVMGIPAFPIGMLIFFTLATALGAFWGSRRQAAYLRLHNTNP